jgi:hypothetical protein
MKIGKNYQELIRGGVGEESLIFPKLRIGRQKFASLRIFSQALGLEGRASLYFVFKKFPPAKKNATLLEFDRI